MGSKARLPRIALLFLGGIAIAGTGCTYMRNRARDLADPFAFGAGFGIGGNIRATQYVQTGFEYTVTSVRTLGREVLPILGPTAEAGLPCAPIFHFRSARTSLFDSATRVQILGRTLLDAQDLKNWYRWSDTSIWFFLPSPKAFRENFDRRLFDIGFSAYLGVGVDFDFNVVELGDFVLGIFGIDFLGDDADDAAPQEVAANAADSEST